MHAVRGAALSVRGQGSSRYIGWVDMGLMPLPFGTPTGCHKAPCFFPGRLFLLEGEGWLRRKGTRRLGRDAQAPSTFASTLHAGMRSATILTQVSRGAGVQREQGEDPGQQAVARRMFGGAR